LPLPNFFIKIVPDKTNSSITIEDSGIGMTKNDMINTLGKAACWEKLAAGEDLPTRLGVGIYSLYIVAKKGASDKQS